MTTIAITIVNVNDDRNYNKNSIIDINSLHNLTPETMNSINWQNVLRRISSIYGQLRIG